MKKYKVVISATITKWITVEAENEDEAVELAHEEFNLDPLGASLDSSTNERYEQEMISCEEIEPTPQPAQGVTHAHMLLKEHGLLDWSRPAKELHDQVRGLQPWPGTSCPFRDGVFKLTRARLGEGSGQPGRVIEAGKRLLVACGEGALEVLEGQLPGKKAVSGRDLVNGGRIQVGEQLG